MCNHLNKCRRTSQLLDAISVDSESALNDQTLPRTACDRSDVILRNANGGWTRFGCALEYLSLKRSVDYVHTYVGTRRQSCTVLYLVHDAQEVHVRGNDLLN